MKVIQNKMRLLFFIGSLRAGGKERRLVELLTYLQEKGCYDILILLTSNYIHYESFHSLGINCQVLPKMWKRNDPTVVYQFYKYCKAFKPDLVHSWGQMQSFYTLPTIALEGIPLINSQITSAPPKINIFSISYVLDRLIFKISTVILSNSKAGLKVFSPPMHKSKVIYNGLNFKRFKGLANVWETKKRYGISTPYSVVMVASVSPHKDYNMFLRIARHVTAVRSDITFIAAGAYFKNDPTYHFILEATEDNPNIIFKGDINDVESLVNACDIGMLLSPNGEGISNAILEYMALGKPVIASNKGGTPEIIEHGRGGYLVQDYDEVETIASYVTELIDNVEKRNAFGEVNRKMIFENFSVERMGKSFEQVYQYALSNNLDVLRDTLIDTIDREAIKQ